ICALTGSVCSMLKDVMLRKGITLSHPFPGRYTGIAVCGAQIESSLRETPYCGGRRSPLITFSFTSVFEGLSGLSAISVPLPGGASCLGGSGAGGVLDGASGCGSDCPKNKPLSKR